MAQQENELTGDIIVNSLSGEMLCLLLIKIQIKFI